MNCTGTSIATFGILCAVLSADLVLGAYNHRSQGSQSNILSPKIEFLAFTVLFTGDYTLFVQSQYICYEQWCIKNSVLQYITKNLCILLDQGGISPVICHHININTALFLNTFFGVLAAHITTLKGNLFNF